MINLCRTTRCKLRRAPYGTILHRTAPRGTERQRTATNDTVRHSTAPHGTVRDPRAPYGTGWHRTATPCAARYRYDTAQRHTPAQRTVRRTVRYRTAPRGTERQCTASQGTVQHRTAPYNTRAPSRANANLFTRWEDCVLLPDQNHCENRQLPLSCWKIPPTSDSYKMTREDVAMREREFQFTLPSCSFCLNQNSFSRVGLLSTLLATLSHLTTERRAKHVRTQGRRRRHTHTLLRLGLTFWLECKFCGDATKFGKAASKAKTKVGTWKEVAASAESCKLVDALGGRPCVAPEGFGYLLYTCEELRLWLDGEGFVSGFYPGVPTEGDAATPKAASSTPASRQQQVKRNNKHL